MLQPIHLICIDDRTRNVYILAGYDAELEFQTVRVIVHPNDPDFDQKVQAAIRRKLKASRNSTAQQSGN